eukprot:SAG31_NODE_14381_length_810_cov_0.936709_1_plen_149_part_01
MHVPLQHSRCNTAEAKSRRRVGLESVTDRAIALHRKHQERMVQLPPLSGSTGRIGTLGSNIKGSNGNGARRTSGGSAMSTSFESICASIPQTKLEPAPLVTKLLQKSRDIAMPPRSEEPTGGYVRLRSLNAVQISVKCDKQNGPRNAFF